MTGEKDDDEESTEGAGGESEESSTRRMAEMSFEAVLRKLVQEKEEREEDGRGRTSPPLSSVRGLGPKEADADEDLDEQDERHLVVGAVASSARDVKINARDRKDMSIPRQIEFRLGALRSQAIDKKSKTSVRQRRVAAALQRFVVEAIYRDRVDPVLVAHNIEIVEVSAGRGLRHAHVFWRSPSLESDKEIEAALARSTRAIRRITTTRLNLRLSPELTFSRSRIDDRARELDALLEQVRNDPGYKKYAVESSEETRESGKSTKGEIRSDGAPAKKS